MKSEDNSFKQPVASMPLSGADPVLEHLEIAGLPLTRENYIRVAGLQEPLGPETEGYLLTLPLESSARAGIATNSSTYT